MNASRALSLASLAAALLLLIMIGISLASGSSQQYFELVMPLEAYAASLLSQATPLRLIIGLDNLFIACYSSAVILLTQVLRNEHNRRILMIVAGAGLAGGVLDYLENHHILGMLYAVEQGLTLTEAEIKLQMVASMFKWHLAYFAFFVLAFAMKPKTAFEKTFQFALLFVQMPVGVFFYVLAGSVWGEILFYARYLNLLVGFVAFALIFHRREEQRGSRVKDGLQPA